ncbi:MAG: DNA internalization-related competence protein ComEC/Rec2 [Peptoniphilaceae bacterium]|nr:DNA internalization-related competence protein ComEC/Rec2 [Peptoniphilaceae bacterium]MDY6086301.1 DNA internalization-related competence protein ComEC/Rec2 [Peptoniphilaceae bacterium]
MVYFITGIALSALGLPLLGAFGAVLCFHRRPSAGLALFLGVVLFLTSDIRKTPSDLARLPERGVATVDGLRYVGGEARLVYRIQVAPRLTLKALSRATLDDDLAALRPISSSVEPFCEKTALEPRVSETHRGGEAREKDGEKIRDEALSLMGWRFKVSVHWHPFEAPGLPGEFHAQEYYATQGIAAQVTLEKATPLKGRALLPALRERARDALLQRMNSLGGEGGALLSRVVLGAQMPVKPALTEAMNGLGLAHLLAASGLHVSLIFAWGMALLSYCRLSRGQSDALLFALLLLYAALLYFPASILRAIFYALTGELAIRRQRRIAPWKRLITALALVLFCFPLRIYDVGLQLSFLCAAAMAWHERSPRPASAIADQLLFTVRILLCTLPVLALRGFTLTPATVIANLLAIPAFSLLFALGLVASLLAPLPVVGTLLCAFFDVSTALFEAFVHGLAALPLPTFSLDATPAFLTLYSLVMIGLVLASTGCFRRLRRLRARLSDRRLRTRWNHTLYTCAVWWALTLVLPLVFAPLEAPTLTALNVGQGDCLLLQAGGKAVLIDTGGKRDFRTKENTQAHHLALELQNRGVARVDAVFLSHDDDDHVGNLWGLAREMPIGVVCVPPGTRRSIAPDSIRVRAMTTGERVTLRSRGAPVSLDVVDAGRGDDEDKNNHAMVLCLHMGRAAVLLMGDREETDGLDLSHVHAPLALLKVAHHGSRKGTEAAFLRRIRPERAVISAGAGNRYGHPAPETLARLRQSGARIDRTDETSHVQYRFNPLPRGGRLIALSPAGVTLLHGAYAFLWCLGLVWGIKKGRDRPLRAENGEISARVEVEGRALRRHGEHEPHAHEV